MIIRCTRCKSKFIQQRVERTCGCKSMVKYESRRVASKRWSIKHAEKLYLLRMARYFQNPIYQWIQEYVTTENFTHYETFKTQANNY